MITNVHGPSTSVTGSSFDNLVVILMENHGLGDIIGPATYMTTLSNTYSLAASYSAVSHPSEPNYCALIAAEFNYCGSDGVCCGQDPGPNIVDRIESAGLTWKAYAEDASGSGTCNFSPPRGGDHFPFLDFADIQTNPTRCSNFQATTSSSDPEFLSALSSPSSAPNFLWLTPNDCDNMHDCSVGTGDSYLAALVPKILASATFTTNRAALFIVFDEGNGSYPSDYVYAAWAGPVVKLAHSPSTQYSHYSFARTIEANWNLPPLTGNDAGASSMAEFFKTTAPPSPSPSPLSASISANASALQVNTGIAITAIVTGGTKPYTVTWNFGDSTTGSGLTVTHIYTAAQTYTVTETVVDSSTPTQTAIGSLSITVFNSVTGNFGACSPLPQGWNCGNTNGLSGSSVNIVNGALGTRQSNPGVGNDTTYYYATTQRGVFPWSPCQAPASGVLPQDLASVSTTFTPLTFTSFGSSTNRYHIYLAIYYWLPNGPVSSSGSTYQCLDTQVRIENVRGVFSPVGTTATYNPGDSFGWDNVTVGSITMGKTYTITASVDHQCKQALLAWGLPSSLPCQPAGIEIGTEGFQFQELDVNWFNIQMSTSSSPLATSYTLAPTTPQAGETVYFSATASGGTGQYTYSWNFSDSHTGAGITVTHTYTTPGSFIVTLTTRDSTSEMATAARTVSVVVPLAANLAWSPVYPVVNQTLTLTAAARGGSQPYKYTWNMGDGATSTGASIAHSYSQPGNYTVKVTVTDSAGRSVSVSRTVTVTAHLVGDLNGDCVVDMKDVLLAANSYGKSLGKPGFDPRADINHDGVVNILDLAMIAAEFGQKC